MWDIYIYLQKRKLAETLDVVEPDSITAQPPVALQDYPTSKQARTFSTMSALELDDMRIPGRSAYFFAYASHNLKTFR